MIDSGNTDKTFNSTPRGKLFGHPLRDLMQDGQLPKVVMVGSNHILLFCLPSLVKFQVNNELQCKHKIFFCIKGFVETLKNKRTVY